MSAMVTLIISFLCAAIASAHVPCTLLSLDSCDSEAIKQLPVLQQMSRAEIVHFVNEKDAELNAELNKTAHPVLAADAGEKSDNAEDMHLAKKAELESLSELAYDVYMLMIHHGLRHRKETNATAKAVPHVSGIENTSDGPGAHGATEASVGGSSKMRTEKKRQSDGSSNDSVSSSSTNSTGSGTPQKKHHHLAHHSSTSASDAESKDLDRQERKEGERVGEAANKEAELADVAPKSLLQNIGRVASSYLR